VFLITTTAGQAHCTEEQHQGNVYTSQIDCLLMLSTKLKLYNTCILIIFLSSSEYCVVTKRDVLKIDALDQWFNHIARMPHETDAKILTAFPLENWRRPPGCPGTTWMKTIQQDLKSNNLSLNEATDMARNCPLRRLMSMFGTMQS